LVVDFETAPDLSEDIALFALESDTCKSMDAKQLWV
jgi:hypothetical protein